MALNYSSTHTGNQIDTAIDKVYGAGYGVCTTAEATAAKTVAWSTYTLQTGMPIVIKFTYGVPANATLNINSTGAKPIMYKNAAITADVIKANAIASFIYDGTNYVLTSVDARSLSASVEQHTLVLG